jgi:hypothetical protein
MGVNAFPHNGNHKCLVLVLPGIKVPEEQQTIADEGIPNPSRYLLAKERLLVVVHHFSPQYL